MSGGTSFREVEDVGRSLPQDRRRKAKKVAKRVKVTVEIGAASDGGLS